MTEPTTRRRFLHQTFAFSAAAVLAGCGGEQSVPVTTTAPVTTPAPVAPPVTPSAPPTVVNLLAVGDWGSQSNITAQTRVAAAMQSYVAANKVSTDAVLMLGDNFYGPLTGGASSTRWKTQFEDMYPASVFNCPFYGMLGNHDYQVEPVDKAAAELAYAAQGTSRWKMPARYYSIALPANDPIVTIVVLDTNRPNEPAQPPPPDSTYFTPTATDVTAQQEWLQKTLSQAPPTAFRMIAAHHPVYSNGAHGDNNTLIGSVDPLLRKHAPHVYLAGHDHDMQHLEFAGHPTSFVLSGGGGAELAALRDRLVAQGPYAREVHGFTHLQVTATLTTVRMIDDAGNLLHAFQKTPDGTVTMIA